MITDVFLLKMLLTSVRIPFNCMSMTDVITPRSDKHHDFVFHFVYMFNYAVSQIKFPPLNSVTLSNLNRFSRFLHCSKSYEICYKTHITLPTSPWACCYTTLGTYKFRFSANIQLIWKMQTNCIFVTSNFVVHPQILIV